MDADHGQLDGRRLNDRPVVADLNELAPVGEWSAGGRQGRRLERFAQMREGLPDRPRLRDEGDQDDACGIAFDRAIF